MATKISIVIPCHKPESVSILLKSIQAQICHFPYEALFVSNLPDSALKKAISSYPDNFKYLETGIIGVNRARNAGILAAKSPCILFLDDDCILEDLSYLQKINDFFERFPNSFLGGIYSVSPNSGDLEITYNLLQRMWLESGFLDSDGSNQYLLGGNFAGPRQVLSENLFDENIIFGGSETELFFRLSQKNYHFFKKNDFVVLHRRSISIKNFIYRAYKQGLGKAYVLKKGFYKESSHQTYEGKTLSENLRKKNIRKFYSYLYKIFFEFAFRTCRDPSLSLYRKVKIFVALIWEDIRYSLVKWDRELTSKMKK